MLLAAGEASRFGAAKQCLPIAGVPMVRRVAEIVTAAGAWPVVVVTGEHAADVIHGLSDLDVHIRHNDEWAQGMGRSLAVGTTALAGLAPDAAIMVLLADQPAVRIEDLHRLLEAHAQTPERIVASRYEGHQGPPCVFPREFAAELQALSGRQGALPLLERHADRVMAIDMPRAAIDIDTPADFAAWLAGEASRDA
ncbi:MAG TPA: nucleotidyltransferase family protein [Dyella sp.]|uniref:nucleotidyltransferase family protein n=1 Tax=Dyella sp. TaxID=1869338 RepID=UPI002D76CA6D|nr:nucleotidyltransferase family protein [Dyella sp.]HET6555594.1 nucleotidyltransferase family protein [Dyella sp.]